MYVSTQNNKINVPSPKLWILILLYTAFLKDSKSIIFFYKRKKKKGRNEKVIFSLSSSEMIVYTAKITVYQRSIFLPSNVF